MRNAFFAIALAIVSLSISSARLYAQATATGTIQGTVVDPSQGVIVGADVVVTSKTTGEKRTSATNGEGNFRFDLLSAGAYSVRITKTGFAAQLQNVDLLVGQTITANATLSPGAATETVEVTAAAPLVDMGRSEEHTSE